MVINKVDFIMKFVYMLLLEHIGIVVRMSVYGYRG